MLNFEWIQHKQCPERASLATKPGRHWNIRARPERSGPTPPRRLDRGLGSAEMAERSHAEFPMGPAQATKPETGGCISRELSFHQRPGSFYIGNMYNVVHGATSPGSWEHRLQIMVMLRSDLFRDSRARMIKSCPGPHASQKSLSLFLTWPRSLQSRAESACTI